VLLEAGDVIRMPERDGWQLSRTRGSRFAVADDQEECLRLIQEAIEFHLEGLRADGEPLPRTATVAATVVTTEAA